MGEDADKTGIETRLGAYKKAKQAIEAFKQALEELVSVSPTGDVTGKEDAGAKSSGGTAASNEKLRKPWVVMIDELDRCRPSYAVELLEVTKHLFSVNHIVFVIAINRQELAHSIKALYGEGFDAEDYLRRFFDVDFRLPEPGREAFINDLFRSTKIADYFMRAEEQEKKWAYAYEGRRLLLAFSETFNLSLRQIQQAVHRVGLVFSSLSDNREPSFLATMAAVLLRTIKPQIYHEFTHGRVSDLEVSQEVFAGSEGKKLQRSFAGQRFEAILILACREIRRGNEIREELEKETGGKYANTSSDTPRENNTPLEKKYLDWAKTKASEGPEKEQAVAVCGLVKSNLDLDTLEDPFLQLNFVDAFKRLELLVGAVMDGSSEGE